MDTERGKAQTTGCALSTAVPAALTTHALRLLPGDDLVRSLRAFATERGLRAACVLSCVGSTSLTTLRPANSSDARVLPSREHEIVSLVGTFSADSHHLHLAVSDDALRTFGGHALEGCVVRTTAEIIIGVLEGVRFDRCQDARTGYNELFIMQAPSALKESGAK